MKTQTQRDCENCTMVGGDLVQQAVPWRKVKSAADIVVVYGLGSMFLMLFWMAAQLQGKSPQLALGFMIAAFAVEILLLSLMVAGLALDIIFGFDELKRGLRMICRSIVAKLARR